MELHPACLSLLGPTPVCEQLSSTINRVNNVHRPQTTATVLLTHDGSAGLVQEQKVYEPAQRSAEMFPHIQF